MWGGAEKKRQQKGENTNIVRYIKENHCVERDATEPLWGFQTRFTQPKRLAVEWVKA